MKWNEEEAVAHRRQHQQYVPDVMNPGRRLFFCWSVVEFLLRGSSGMEMKRSYGFTRRKECWLSLYGRERKILLSATWPMNDSFLGLYILRGSGVGDQGQQEARAIVEFRFFRRSKLQSCLLGLEETKKKKIWPGGDDKFILFHICSISFDGPHWAVIDVVFQKTNATCICFGANGKKTK